MTKMLLVAAAAALAATVGAAPAGAKPAHAGNHKGHGQMAQHGPMGHDMMGQHSKGYGTGHCPPGLAKKNPQCMPPGQWKQRYQVGQQLPQGYNNWVGYNQIPAGVVPQGYRTDPYARYAYDQGTYYQVDPTTMVIQQVLGSLVR